MKSIYLRTTEAKKVFKRVFQAISAEEQNEVFAEAAYPAYAHSNPLIDHLFWGRLAVVERYIASSEKHSILDFGCGSGIMSWIMAPSTEKVYATDVVPVTFERMKAVVEFPLNITFVSGQDLELHGEQLGIRTIIALDVLEHVEDVRTTLLFFKKLLKGKGEVIISGPTENILYKAGRLVAGKRFTGNYHRTDISHIKKMCKEVGRVTDIQKLYSLIPFFDIFSVRFE